MKIVIELGIVILIYFVSLVIGSLWSKFVCDGVSAPVEKRNTYGAIYGWILSLFLYFVVNLIRFY